MDKNNALATAIDFAKSAIEHQSDRAPIVLSANAADEVADFIMQLAKRLEEM